MHGRARPIYLLSNPRRYLRFYARLTLNMISRNHSFQDEIERSIFKSRNETLVSREQKWTIAVIYSYSKIISSQFVLKNKLQIWHDCRTFFLLFFSFLFFFYLYLSMSCWCYKFFSFLFFFFYYSLLRDIPSTLLRCAGSSRMCSGTSCRSRSRSTVYPATRWSTIKQKEEEKMRAIWLSVREIK